MKYPQTFSTILWLLLAIIFLISPRSVSAKTYMSTFDREATTTLTKAGNPYILDEDFRPSKRLTINEGVVIQRASTTSSEDWNYQRGPYMDLSAGVDMFGTEKEPIHLIGLAQTVIMKPVSSRIEFVHFENSSLYLVTGKGGPFGSKVPTGYMATTTIISSKISNSHTAPSALELNSGALVIVDSEIGDNNVGIAYNTFADKNYIEIKNSVLENNSDYSIKAMPFVENSEDPRIHTTIVAVNNWWGSTDGPGGKILGPAIIDPWLTEDPRIKKIECCSNVLFLPGFQASRLNTSTNRLWEPNRNMDVRKLHLDSDGNTIDESIYTSGIIDSAYGTMDIYTKFIAMMNSVVADKIINEWIPFAYDWRMGQSDIVIEETSYATTTKRLLDEVERLALTSKTGKVTIVSHSNGGLVAKMLGSELEKKGKTELIDKVLFVAVPKFGTPQAVAGLLHGDNQSLGSGFFLDGSTARTFGLNMLGAYGLLPSLEYFNRAVEPVVKFIGQAIGSHQGLNDFLTARSDGRLQPKESDLKSPTILSSPLLSKAIRMHSIADSWNFPTTTETISFVGWGTPTAKTIEYFSTSTMRINKDLDGDGTVATVSAIGNDESHSEGVIYFNQGLFNAKPTLNLFNISHANILEAEPLRNIIQKAVSTSSLASVVNVSKSQYLSREKPDPAQSSLWRSYLVASVHSPVDMDVYDSKGGHMGLIPLLGNPDSDIMYLENTIGGQYHAIGDEKYFTLPADDTYTVKLKGTGTGNFTFQVQKFVGRDMIEVANTLYTDLPVTPLLIASTTINSFVLSPLLNLDFDGNGITDMKSASSTSINPLIHLESIKVIISSLKLDSSLEKSLFKKIENIRKGLEKDKHRKVAKKLKNMLGKLENQHWNIKKLSDTERQSILSHLKSILASLETL